VTGSQLGGPGGGAVPGSEPVGTCCFVLHSHLPRVAHASAWPVECGDEAAARSAAEACRRTDGPFGFLDARRL
jgi:hypothetical protein